MRSSHKVLLKSFSAVAMSVAIAFAAWPLVHLPIQAQVNRIQQATDFIYSELPNFPKENDYVSGDGAEPGNTLIRRLLAYHIYVQGRPTQSRTDWKLTLADYLNLNEP
ncbi:MAG: hypothetical protein AAFX40_03685, partial [Cyanobacteria bacterium J06639_1]